jgi:hypothetical protein
MGVDIELRSVLTAEVHEAIVERALAQLPKPDSIEDFERIAQASYDAVAATGAYFRDPYNRFGLLPVLGMDWLDDVGPLLSADELLSIEGARHLLVEIERRPVTSEAIADALDGPGDPMTAWMEKHGAAKPAADIDRGAVFDFLIEKRRQLMALLRRSIELGEPLHCSL